MDQILLKLIKNIISENSVLNFFLLILKILLNLSPDAYYKCSRFLKILLEKNFKFVLNRKNTTIPFYLNLALLFIEVNLVSKKLSYKKDVFMGHNISHIERVFVLSTKIIAFYI